MKGRRGMRFVKGKCDQLKGRSMIEMLGVLAVVGVLSIAALAGFQYAMNKHRANETIHDVMLRATNVPMIDEMYTARPAGYEWLFAGLPSDGKEGTYYAMNTITSDLSAYVYQVVVDGVSQKVCQQILDMNPRDVDAIYVNANEVSDEDCPSDVNVMAFYFDGHFGGNEPDKPLPPVCVGSDCDPDGGCVGANCTVCVGKDCGTDGLCTGSDCTSCTGSDCGSDGTCNGSDCTQNPPTPPEPSDDPCDQDPDSLACQERCEGSSNPYCCRYPNDSACACPSRPSCTGCEAYVFDAKGCVTGCENACNAQACQSCVNNQCQSICTADEECQNGVCVEKCSVVCSGTCEDTQIGVDDKGCPVCGPDPDPCCGKTPPSCDVCEEPDGTCSGCVAIPECDPCVVDPTSHACVCQNEPATCGACEIEGVDENGCKVCEADPDPCCGLTGEEAACCAAPNSSEDCVRFCLTHPENCVNDPCPEGGQTDAICCAVDESGTWCGSVCCPNGQTCGLDGACCPALDPATCPNGTTTDDNGCSVCVEGCNADTQHTCTAGTDSWCCAIGQQCGTATGECLTCDASSAQYDENLCEKCGWSWSIVYSEVSGYKNYECGGASFCEALLGSGAKWTQTAGSGTLCEENYTAWRCYESGTWCWSFTGGYDNTCPITEIRCDLTYDDAYNYCYVIAPSSCLGIHEI